MVAYASKALMEDMLANAAEKHESVLASVKHMVEAHLTKAAERRGITVTDEDMTRLVTKAVDKYAT